MKTLEEVKEYIKKNVNEVDLLEVLDISSEELVEAFSDEIEENIEKLIAQLDIQDTDDE